MHLWGYGYSRYVDLLLWPSQQAYGEKGILDLRTLSDNALLQWIYGLSPVTEESIKVLGQKMGDGKRVSKREWS